MASQNIPTVQLVDPTGFDPGEAPLVMAARPIDLRGGRLGLLDNSKANADAILWAIANALNDEFEFADIFYARKHSASLPPHPELLADLHRNSDFVIAGVGD
ncbi:MAG: hypothetical protein OXF79_08035 [Chloroflexi bacterium]|nr:hypothetical protein [Chloroflexota bacterium]